MLSLVYSEGQKLGGDVTVSAALAKPPDNRATANIHILTAVFIGAFVAFYLLFMSFEYVGSAGLLISTIITFAVHQFLLMPITRKNRAAYESDLMQWQNTALCQRCDTQFFVQ